jgi:hypothetical protein
MSSVWEIRIALLFFLLFCSELGIHLQSSSTARTRKLPSNYSFTHLPFPCTRSVAWALGCVCVCPSSEDGQGTIATLHPRPVRLAVADGWCWYVLREKYCWLIVGDWFVLREKYWWLISQTKRAIEAFLIWWLVGPQKHSPRDEVLPSTTPALLAFGFGHPTINKLPN